MNKINPYLNFDGTCEKVFLFYQTIFGGEFLGKIARLGDAPVSNELSEKDKDRVMHIALPIGNDLLMGSDIYPNGMHHLIEGNNNIISIFPESRDEANRIFESLAKDGVTLMPLQDTFWGDYYGQLKDKFGIFWMINYSESTTDGNV